MPKTESSTFLGHRPPIVQLIMTLVTKWICLHVLAWTTVAAKPTFNRQSSVGLWLASYNGDIAAMRASIESNADLDWKNTDDDEIGHTPLMAAAQRGNHEAVSFLIQSSCDVHATDSKGRTAKSMAQAKEQEAVVAIIEKWEDANNVGLSRKGVRNAKILRTPWTRVFFPVASCTH